MAPPGSHPAVFVDRDGVICENRPDHVKSWAEFAFIPGSVEALASFTRAGVPVFVTTNQAAVGRGVISRHQLDVIHDRMLSVIRGSGAKVQDILICTHHPDDRCSCRKPEPGLLLDAASAHDIDLAHSFMIGDSGSDVIAGARAGCSTVLVRTGRGRDTIRDRSWGEHKPDFVADDLVDATIWILGRKAMDYGAHSEVPST